MPAGTIALTNNSTAVTGSGTNFSSELKANDFLVAIVGGVTYTLGVQSVNSATSVTLTTAYNGPTASGVAWTAVPNAALVGITAQVAADVAKAIRGLNLDKANWQQVYSASGNITVTLPDGSQYSGPSWNSVAGSVTGKMDKSQNLNDVADKATARTNLGLKNSATRDVGTTSGTVAAGDDSRLNTVDGKTGGTVSTGLGVSGLLTAPAIGRISGLDQAMTSQGTYLNWNRTGISGGSDFVNNRGAGQGGFRFRIVNADNTSLIADYTMQASGVGISPGGWTTGSDERIKEDIKDVDPEYALDAVLNMRHVTFKMRDIPDGDGGWYPGIRSAGFLAQDLRKYVPDVVMDAPEGSTYSFRGDNNEIVTITDMLSIDPGKAAAALHGPAIKRLYELLQEKDLVIAELQQRMKAIDGLDA
ncbi:tail fiber domain-containing protein [Pantoea brenneri]|uniref:Tail fiber domain-containing protein n=2 Tax=Pantoea brenneri TaxID=472694 RepID=A0AAX3JCW7_9GAMM|nr:tail fiber domain-containing protein [Pantoea brenneri]MDH2121874.1 tail fiber domain-containing protein [Pantoea brenneri]VXC64267.1 Tail fiber domain-containing protein [Pantoea brenneri]